MNTYGISSTHSCISLLSPFVKSIMTLVDDLEKNYYQSMTEYRSISSLNDVYTKTQILSENPNLMSQPSVVRYFFTASVVAKSLLTSHKSNKHDLSSLKLCVPDFVSLENLNVQAHYCVEDLIKYLSKMDYKLHNLGYLKGFLDNFDSVPYLKVYEDNNKQVFLRRGFYLSCSGDTDTQPKVSKTYDEPLSYFPHAVYRNREQTTGHQGYLKLSEIINNDTYRKLIFKNKLISFIKLQLATAKKKAIFEIDFIDHNVHGNADLYESIEKDLELITGEKKETSSDTLSRKETIVSFFSHVLFTPDLTNNYICEKIAEHNESCNHDNKCPSCYQAQEIENWAENCIKKIVKDVPSEVYLGFCFRSVLKRNYMTKCLARSNIITLLIAFTRGITKLMENLPKSTILMNEDVREKNISSYKTLEIRFLILSVMGCIARKNRDVKDYGLVKREILEKSKYTVKVTNDSLTVRTGISLVLVVVISFDIASVLAYGILMGIRQRNLNNPNWDEYSGGLAAVATAIFGLSLFLLKLVLPDWNIMDMIHRRKTVYSMSELMHIHPKSKCLEILSRTLRPSEFFSKHGSNAFTANGKGRFNMDAKIFVRDLQQVGYSFGLDFYGNSVVLDPIGRIRKLDFSGLENSISRKRIAESIAKEAGCTTFKYEHYEYGEKHAFTEIQGLHDHKLGYIFKVPIANVQIGRNDLADSDDHV